MTETNLYTPGENGSLELQGALGIDKVCRLKDILTDALNRTDDLVLKIEDIEGAGLSTLQLLWSAHRTANSTGKRITLDDATRERLSTLVERAGLSRLQGSGFDGENTCFWIGGAK